MMLEIAIGETIAVRFDDCMDDQRLTPEQVGDYLNRMRRTAMDMYDGMPNEEPTTVEDVERVLNPDED